MRITQYDKEAIICNIMNDVPEDRPKITKDGVQVLLVNAMSPPVRKLYATHPKALAHEYVSGYSFGMDFHANFAVGDADVKQVFAVYKAKKDARTEVLAKVAVAIKSCTTLKQLLDRFPEFTKYYPTKDAPTKNLPAVIGLEKDLKALGWPKGEVAK
jgi:hypothetical protein